MYFNIFTKKEFTGKNLEVLQLTNLTGGFATLYQFKKLGGRVPKGSKAVARLIRPTQNEDVEGNKSFRTYCVFHESQIIFDGEKKVAQ